MSKLDSFIRRMLAQRDALNQIAAMIPPDGPIVELGLGNGRTYDHLAEQYGPERLYVFDRNPWPTKLKVPFPAVFIHGEIVDTAPLHVGLGAVLLHADIGSGDETLDEVTLSWLPNLIERLTRPGGLVLSGLPLATSGLHELPLQEVNPGRYFLYRRSRDFDAPQ